MAKRAYVIITDLASGIRFRFSVESPNPLVLHIEARHDVTAQDAIQTCLNAQTSYWNETNRRWESETSTHLIYWTTHYSGVILVITCVRKEE